MKARDQEIVQRPAQVTEEATRQKDGELLPPDIASEFGAHFGADFSNVRVHHDAGAARGAEQAGAQAFTRGRDITFGEGRYNPSSGTGRELLAHELAHVVQQRGGGATADAETRAERAGASAARGGRVSPQTLGSAPIGVQTKPDDQPQPAPKPEAETKKEKDEAAVSTGLTFSKVIDNFTLDKDTITAQHMKGIDEIAGGIGIQAGMRMRAKVKIEIVGHADTTGKDPHNEELAQKRADRVKEALEKKLTPREGERPVTYEWSVRSAGEKELLIPTPDETLEPRNRAVEVRVTVDSIPEVKPPEAPKKPTTDPNKYEPPEGPEKPPKQPPKGPTREWWDRAQENQRKIDEFDKKHPRKPKSAQEVIVDTVMENVVDPVLKKLPLSKDKKDWLRDKIKDGVEAGTEKGCEAAVDATGAKGAEADALKAACKAAIKQKQEEKK